MNGIPILCPKCGVDNNDRDDWSAFYQCGTVLMTKSAPIFRQSAECLERQRNQLAERVFVLEGVLQGIVDGCVNPDTAVRRVMVDLAPIRDVLKTKGRV